MPLPKKRSSTRRRSRSQRKVGGGEKVFVLYESGEHLDESPKLISVFRNRDAAVDKVKDLIKPMNVKIQGDGEFEMEKKGGEMVAYSEYHKGGFYVKELPFEE